jgi:hypothetical protein
MLGQILKIRTKLEKNIFFARIFSKKLTKKSVPDKT